jgi:hypothetical protein
MLEKLELGNMVSTPGLRKQLNYVEGRVGMEIDGVPQVGALKSNANPAMSNDTPALCT